MDVNHGVYEREKVVYEDEQTLIHYSAVSAE